MLPKFRLEPNEELDPDAGVPKIEGEEPKAGVVVPPRIEGEVLEPNPGTLEPPKSEVEVVVEPKGLDDAALNGGLKIVDEEPKPDEPKEGVLGANGFDAEEEEKGFEAVWPNVLVEPKGFGWVVEKLTPGAVCPAAFGPPGIRCYKYKQRNQ